MTLQNQHRFSRRVVRSGRTGDGAIEQVVSGTNEPLITKVGGKGQRLLTRSMIRRVHLWRVDSASQEEEKTHEILVS